ncbi:feruloyl-CoA synthase [Massilia yuzhufengensis]|uniref:Trans-feruloyl-CoA synthase n=1 Tax=Massilia yuzhufengensis TaxID=1164594 RepID=A0A1I1N4G5_9BURK|nr:feruloyl-CoA synthase [Massilia yuzhufengensis]SFC92246.1 trans-feruloyl-CoA synthase [Massilia yuzhufengensis]
MEAHVRYRPVAFGDDAVRVREAKGATYVQAVAPLGSYARRTTDRLRHWAQQAPERSFIARRCNDGAWRHISYAQALGSARAIGQALLDRGLSSQRPVVILSGNDLEHAMLALACQYVGVPYAPISPAYSLVSQDFDKLRHIVKLLNPGLVFAADGAAFGRAMAACCGPDVEFVVTGGMPDGREATLFSALESSEPSAAVDAAMEAVGPETIAKFLFTSGSTKLPKAVVNTHRMLCSNMQMLAQVWPFLLEEPPVLLDWLPWNHTFGGNKDFNLVLFNGGTLYIDDGKPTPQLIGTTIANLREIAPTIYFNVPKGWDDLANALASDTALRDNFYSRLKLQFYAGAALAQPVWDKLHASAESACGERIRMTTGLGMTETAPCALFAMREDVHAGELGVPSPGMEVKLVPCGDKLEVRYRGPSVTPGYWKAPEETAAMFDEEGFFCSGDAVKWLDPQQPHLGFVFDGRVAEDFKLYTGTWVSVGPLRGRIMHEGAPYVQDAVVTGHDRADIGLLIIPNLAQCRTLAALGEGAAPGEVLAAGPVRAYFDQLVKKLHGQGSGSATRVTRALLLTEPPSIDRGEITDKGSINQRAVLTHRAALVELLYAGQDPAIFHAGAH